MGQVLEPSSNREVNDQVLTEFDTDITNFVENQLFPFINKWNWLVKLGQNGKLSDQLTERLNTIGYRLNDSIDRVINEA